MLRFLRNVFCFEQAHRHTYGAALTSWLIVASSASGMEPRLDQREYAIDTDGKPNWVVCDDGYPPLFEVDDLLKQEFKLAKMIGHFQFGNLDAHPVVVVYLDEPATNPKLYVDCNRDGRLTLDEQQTKSDKAPATWLVKIAPGQHGVPDDRVPKHDDYTVRIRYYENHLEAAHAGKLRGQVSIDGKAVLVQLEDCNCNGDWSDTEDRILIDWDSSQSFNRITERYSCQSAPIHNGHRHSIAMSELGLSIEPILKTGEIIPKIRLVDSLGKVEKIEATLASKDGVHITVTDVDKPIQIPIGTYTVKQVRLKARDDRAWNIVFNQDQSNKFGTAVEVIENTSAEIDLLGSLTLSGRIVELNNTGAVSVLPELKSSSGLYLSRQTVGKLTAQEDSPLIATVFNVDQVQNEVSVETRTTGFACGSFCPIRFENISASKFRIQLSFDSGPLAGVMAARIEPSPEDR